LTKKKDVHSHKRLLYPYKIHTKPKLSQIQKEKRYKYSLAMRSQNPKFYQHTIFMDEKSCVFNKPANKQNSRRWMEPHLKDHVENFEKNSQSVVVNSFGAIHYLGKSDLRFYIEKQPLKKNN